MSNVLCQQKTECQDFIFANLIENGIAWSFCLFEFMLPWIWMRFNKNGVLCGCCVIEQISYLVGQGHCAHLAKICVKVVTFYS